MEHVRKICGTCGHYNIDGASIAANFDIVMGFDIVTTMVAPCRILYKNDTKAKVGFGNNFSCIMWAKDGHIDVNLSMRAGKIINSAHNAWELLGFLKTNPYNIRITSDKFISGCTERLKKDIKLSTKQFNCLIYDYNETIRQINELKNI